MDSFLSLLRTHWDHEPLRLTEARSGPRVCDPQPARFVENTVSACKKSRPMAGFSLQSTCREFRESDRTNKFYRPRSPPRPRIPHFRLRERGRGRQVRPIPVDRRCSSLQPKPVAAHLLTFPLSPLRPRQARRTVLLWLRSAAWSSSMIRTPADTFIRSNTRLGFVKELSLFGQQLSLGRRFQIGLGLYAVTRRLQNQPVVTREGGGLEFLRT